MQMEVPAGKGFDLKFEITDFSPTFSTQHQKGRFFEVSWLRRALDKESEAVQPL
jgi:hypothetical protein